jgi:exopolysaccharide biosynthesis polyprenyl glycosylphosphotransferase
MAEARRRLLIVLLKMGDVASVALVFAAVLIGFVQGGTLTGWREFLELRVSLLNVLFGLGHIGVWYLALVGFGLYRSYRLSPSARELKDLAMASAVAVVSLVPAAIYLDYAFVTGQFLAIYYVAVLGLLATERRVFRALARRLRSRGFNIKNVVIIGDDDSALGLPAELIKREELGYRVIRVIDAAGPNDPISQARSVTELEETLDGDSVDEVFVALSLEKAHTLVRRLIATCEEQGVIVRVVADVADLGWGHAMLDEVGGRPVVSVFSGQPFTIQHVVKRAIDLVGAAAGLVLVSPILLIAALAIRLDSAGPVFYVQERIGQNRRRFKIYKLRTMVADAATRQSDLEALNEADGPVFKIADDPRVTRLGWWLRRFSIDELPQFVNVVKGDMSLVGPRPLPLRDVERIDVRWHNRRFSVKPGITCLWQVRARVPLFAEWVKADMEYIDNWSLKLDMRILLATIPAVILGSGTH